jgi:hypothetical protein
MAAERVKRLKDLVEMLMRLPESPERERLLAEVRSRAVDVDTGVAPRAMLPLREPVPASLAAMPAKRHAAVQPRRAPAPPRPHLDPQPTWDTVLGAADHLSLDDSPPGDGQPARLWTLGLRG